VFAEGSVVEAADLVHNVDDLRAIAAAADAPRASSSAPPAGADHDDEAESLVPDGESIATDVTYAQVRRGATSLSAMKRQIERDCIARYSARCVTPPPRRRSSLFARSRLLPYGKQERKESGPPSYPSRRGRDVSSRFGPVLCAVVRSIE